MNIENVTFESFGFKNEINKGVQEAGFTIPSPIQSLAIPEVLQGKDLIAQAHTGTGKTAAFGLPMLNMIDPKNRGEALVITPTRELATQVSDELYKLGQYCGIKTATVYGGQSYSRQLNLIDRGANIIVATPGRLLDLLKGDKIKIKPKFVVLDEADEMLDMGFLDDIKEIFMFIPENRQTLLFSATMPQAIKNLAQTILKEPKFITVSTKETTNVNIKQQYYVIDEHERDDALARILDSCEKQKSIVFCRMKKEVDRVATMLIGRGYGAGGLHGDMEQRQRETIIKSFKQNELDILVATDVAARGIDISGVSHVFNYHIPFDPESYVHRIGRTGRGGATGIAITFVTPQEFRELDKIKSLIKTDIELAHIPSAKEITSSNLTRNLDKIRNQEVKPEAIEMLNTLKDSIDLTNITLKLLSMFIEEKRVDGPEHIGINPERLKKLLLSRDSRNQGGGGNRSSRGRGSYRGNNDRNRSGGGGGYRDNSQRDGSKPRYNNSSSGNKKSSSW